MSEERSLLIQESKAVAELNHVPGFDPLKLIQKTLKGRDFSENQLPQLVLKYKKLWFRLACPHGRIRLIARHLTEEIAIVEAEIYRDRGDTAPVANFVASRTAKDTPGGLYIQAAQYEAVDNALTDAGFGIQLCDVCKTLGEDAYIKQQSKVKEPQQTTELRAEENVASFSSEQGEEPNLPAPKAAPEQDMPKASSKPQSLNAQSDDEEAHFPPESAPDTPAESACEAPGSEQEQEIEPQRAPSEEQDMPDPSSPSSQSNEMEDEKKTRDGSELHRAVSGELEQETAAPAETEIICSETDQQREWETEPVQAEPAHAADGEQELGELTLICRNYQFSMGLNVTEKANCRVNGFHCAANPFDCLVHYPDTADSEYYLVNAEGDMDEDNFDSKISCTELTILRKLELDQLLLHGLAYMAAHPLQPWSSRVIRDSATAFNGCAVVRGTAPCAQGKIGDILALAQENELGTQIVEICMAHVDGNKVLPGTWYGVDLKERTVPR